MIPTLWVSMTGILSSEVTNFDNMAESATLMTGGSVLPSGKGDSWSIKNAGSMATCLRLCEGADPLQT